MPVTFEIYPELRLLKVDYAGEVALAEISTTYREFLDTPGSEKVKYSLSDLSELNELRVFYDGSAMLASVVASDGGAMAEPWEIAIVSTNLKHYALLSDYVANITRNSSMRCEILKDIPSALDWLGLAPDAIAAKAPKTSSDTPTAKEL
ncbi:hypothetical protein [Pelagimonas varians]|uniref:SpoIIAA-like protein n=1 Tax=Pelagimonas varians TaxID=696760 RepID=A0A238KBU3_9RHOB|nr:hypothetical protein [Pelagimonas varians]PYG31044.1 hypothetical protein C8N36_10599 [Pelagimonas varians]SMX39516.1 hypothetical protein PEV8663_01741 [Pelagimonas varians]